ncbi:hypothetical protein ACS0TY_030460 [Phlomoides rotata]
MAARNLTAIVGMGGIGKSTLDWDGMHPSTRRRSSTGCSSHYFWLGLHSSQSRACAASCTRLHEEEEATHGVHRTTPGWGCIRRSHAPMLPRDITMKSVFFLCVYML